MKKLEGFKMSIFLGNIGNKKYYAKLSPIPFGWRVDLIRVKVTDSKAIPVHFELGKFKTQEEAISHATELFKNNAALTL